MVVNKPPPSSWILHHQTQQLPPRGQPPSQRIPRIPNLAGSPQRVPLQPVTANRISSSYGSSNVFTLTEQNPTFQDISNERIPKKTWVSNSSIASA